MGGERMKTKDNFLEGAKVTRDNQIFAPNQSPQNRGGQPGGTSNNGGKKESHPE